MFKISWCSFPVVRQIFGKFNVLVLQSRSGGSPDNPKAFPVSLCALILPPLCTGFSIPELCCCFEEDHLVWAAHFSSNFGVFLTCSAGIICPFRISYCKGRCWSLTKSHALMQPTQPVEAQPSILAQCSSTTMYDSLPVAAQLLVSVACLGLQNMGDAKQTVGHN